MSAAVRALARTLLRSSDASGSKLAAAPDDVMDAWEAVAATFVSASQVGSNYTTILALITGHLLIRAHYLAPGGVTARNKTDVDGKTNDQTTVGISFAQPGNGYQPRNLQEAELMSTPLGMQAQALINASTANLPFTVF